MWNAMRRSNAISSEGLHIAKRNLDMATQWNSRPKLRIYINEGKHLVIENGGVTGIEDLQLRFTEYDLSSEFPGHVSKASVPFFSVMGGLFPAPKAVMPGTSADIDLTAMPSTKFYKNLPEAGSDWQRKVYCFRLSFGNAVNHQRYVKYLLTSPSLIMPDSWGAAEKVATGGPLDTYNYILHLRDTIKAHQAAFFEDKPEDLYRY
jgi:hypothetical protein